MFAATDREPCPARDSSREEHPPASLDPADWTAVRALGHRMLDDMFDYIEHIRRRPAWRPIPREVRARFHDRLPVAPASLDTVYEEFTRSILPFSTGNAHPAFVG